VPYWGQGVLGGGVAEGVVPGKQGGGGGGAGGGGRRLRETLSGGTVSGGGSIEKKGREAKRGTNIPATQNSSETMVGLFHTSERRKPGGIPVTSRMHRIRRKKSRQNGAGTKGGACDGDLENQRHSESQS